MNKHEERFYVERTAEMLNLSWTVGEDRESPDFIISAGDWQFGLEAFISPHTTQSIFDAISVFISTACVVSVLDRG